MSKIELTPRERDILECLASGYESSDIASELRVSGTTVKGYRKTLFLKLRAKNAAHAVAIAYQTNILP